MLRRRLTLSLAALLAMRSLAAQEPLAPPRDTLAPVVVTATRVAVATVAPTASATVLRGADLRAQGITRVLDALRLVPGAAIVASGPVGSQTSLFLRGGNSNYVRILVDGVAVNDAGGAIDLSTLTTDNVDRIEIVRGPASVLYGSDAVSGVVQIFTREGRGAPAVRALAGGGTQGTAYGEMGFSAGGERAGITLAGSHHATAGILAFNNRFVNDVLSASLRAVPDAHTDARLSVRWSSSSYHYPTDYTGDVVDHNSEQADHRLVLSLDAARRLGRRAELRVAITSHEFLPRTNDGPDSSADTAGFFGFYARATRTRRTADAHLDVRLGSAGVLTLGGEVARDRERSSSRSLSQYGSSTGDFEAARHNAAVYVQALGDAAGRWSYSVGGRLDENSAFGTFRTVRASVGYALSGAARVRASVGSAFKAPSFFENFATGYVTGNRALRPERSRGAEVGLDAYFADGALRLSATGYRQRFRDVIDYTGAPPAAGAPNYYNVAAADANGAELQAEVRATSRLVITGGYAWTDTRVSEAGYDSTSGATYVRGQPLIRRPPHSLTLSAALGFGRGGQAQLVATRVGARDDRDFTPYPAEPVTLPAYTKVDVSTVIPLPWRAGDLALVARVDNVFGARYEEIARFAAPGRTGFVGVRVGR